MVPALLKPLWPFEFFRAVSKTTNGCGSPLFTATPGSVVLAEDTTGKGHITRHPPRGPVGGTRGSRLTRHAGALKND